MIDEGPSSDDLDRFGGDAAHCPECGAEIWDQAECCPSCNAYIVGGTLSKPPLEHWLKQRWVTVIAILLAVLFSGVLALRFLF